MADTFWQERLTKTKALVVAYEDAILAISTGGATTSYWLDTGQTMQKVTKEDLSSLNETLEQLLNRVAVLEARCNGAAIVMRPAF